MSDIFVGIIMLIYVAGGVWAVNKLYYSKVDMIVIGSYSRFFMGKIAIAMFFGWILIPVAVIVTLIENRKK